MSITNASYHRSVAAIGTAIAVGIVPVFTEFVKFEVIVIIWWVFVCCQPRVYLIPSRLVSAAVTDLIIAIALSYHLVATSTMLPRTFY